MLLLSNSKEEYKAKGRRLTRTRKEIIIAREPILEAWLHAKVKLVLKSRLP